LNSHTQDDAFHEIQLNGKQLVFLFMAATVVSVVIFLCGVLVGRGVRTERAATGADVATVASATDPTPQRVPPPQPAAGSDPTVAAPPQAVDDFSYFNRLEKPGKTADDLKPAQPRESAAKSSAAETRSAAKNVAASKTAAPARTAAPPDAPAPSVKSSQPAVAASAKETPVVAAKTAAAAAPSTDSASADQGSGFAVQIAALNAKNEADAIARRLSSKGYAAYVLSPSTGTPSVYRVRVGKFGTRREAESVAAKLQKEEQYKPWITR
jgi:cell division septation protein DedD